MEKSRLRPTRTDIAAVGVFCALAALLLTAAFYQNPAEDEMFYYTLAQRFAQGDRLLADDWHLAQLATILQAPFYRLFVALNGGTAGLLPAMRLVFVAGDLALFWFFFVKMRRLRLFGVLAAFFLCADLFAGLLAVNYYNVGVHGLSVLCLCLITADRRPSFCVSVFCGVVLAAVVLTEPSMTAAYLVYGLAVLLRAVLLKKKKTDIGRELFVLDVRVWAGITAGAALCAAALCIYLAAAVGFGTILENLPQFFSDSEYGMAWYGNRANPHKLFVLRQTYGVFALAAAPALVALCAFLGRKNAAKKAKAAALVACLLWCAYCFSRIFMNIETEYFKCSSFPVFVFSLCAMLLCKTGNRRTAACWLAALVCSAAVDYVSEVTVLYAGRLCYIPAAFACASLRRELFHADEPQPPQKKHAAKKRDAAAGKPLRAAAALFAGISLLLNGAILFLLTDGGVFEHKTQTVSVGPLQGMRCTEAFARSYGGVLADMDLIPETAGTLYVAGMMPVCYLYRCDLRNGAYAQWCVERDIAPRQTAYWTLHPEKRPDVVYVPGCIYNFTPYTQAYSEKLLQEKYDFIESLGEFTVLEGDMGRLYLFEKENGGAA